MLAKGSTAIEGRSGSGRAGLIALFERRRFDDRLGVAKSGNERLGRGIGLGVQLAPEQHDQGVIVLEGFGLASRRGQRLHDHPMGVFAHVVERDGALGGLEGRAGMAGGQLLFAEAHQRAKGHIFQALPLPGEPLGPALFADGDVVHEPASVEIGCCRQGLARVLANQVLETADVACDRGGVERHDVAIALQRVLPDDLAQPEQRLPQVLLGLGVEMGTPQKCRQLLALLRPGAHAGKIGQQAGQLLVGKVDRALWPCKLDATEQRQAEFRGGRQRLVPMGPEAGPESLPGTAFCIFHGTPGKINAPVTAF